MYKNNFKLKVMSDRKLIDLLKIAYLWGRDNGERKSEKNFNDLLQTEVIKEGVHFETNI